MSRHKQGQNSEGRPSRFGSLLGLAAFLPFFLLPLIYYGHLTNLSPPAVSRDLSTDSPALESRADETDLSHQSNACPICQAASSFQDYGLFPAFHAPDGAALLGPLSERSASSAFAQADGLALQSRAPPVLPLPQTTA